ncbi:hypothetical protein LCL95_01525 [Bacillus timonensis]|nr:hypothetical protein [Bacillus timonensis]
MKSLFIQIGDHIVMVKSTSKEAMEFVANGFKIVPPEDLLNKTAFLVISIEYGYGYPFKNFDVSINKDNGTVFYKREDYLIKVDQNYSNASLFVYNDFALKHALMNLYSAFIVHHNWGLLIHSSCMKDNEKAFLFTGHSGAGKSTVVELSSPRVILSDEATVVKISNHGVKAYDSPFRSDTVSSFSEGPLELGGIQLLEQSLTIQRSRLTKSESMMNMLDKIFYWAYDPLETQKLFNLVYQLIELVPVYNLKFQKNNAFWKEIS